MVPLGSLTRTIRERERGVPREDVLTEDQLGSGLVFAIIDGHRRVERRRHHRELRFDQLGIGIERSRARPNDRVLQELGRHANPRRGVKLSYSVHERIFGSTCPSAA